MKFILPLLAIVLRVAVQIGPRHGFDGLKIREARAALWSALRRRLCASGGGGGLRSSVTPRMVSRLATVFAVGIVAAFTAMQSAVAADYPTKPVKLMLGFAPGGQADILGRTLGQKFMQILGQPLVIDYRPGAGGRIAAEAAARAVPDGYTLLMVDQGMLAANVTLYKKLDYNPGKDFIPISLIGSQAQVLVVHPSVPARSMAELIALAKEKPGTLYFASGGLGGAAHLSGELFKAEAKVDIVHVPFKGTGPALQDVVAGRIQITFSAASPLIGYIRSGAVRPLAVSTATRTAILPDIPTIAELGLPRYALGTWNGLAAPAGTPKEIIATVHRATATALNDPEVRKRLTDMGVDVTGNSPEEFQAFIDSEIIKWSAIVKTSGTQLD